MNFSAHAFIFDMDGVIIDSNPVHAIALRRFCKQYGYHFTEEELIKRIYGRTNKEWIANLFGAVSKEELTRLGEEKEALFRDLYKDTIKPLAGLLEFLAQLKQLEIPRAIATSAPRSNVDFTLEKTLIGPYFTTILDESFVTHGKPDPEIYLKTAHALGLPPGNCVVFEDSLSGVKAGKAAGCKVIGITTTHTPEELTEVDTTTGDFRGLQAKVLLEELF